MNMTKNSLAIGYCHRGMVHEPFMRSVLHFALADHNRADVLAGYASHNNLYVAMGRHEVVKEFLTATKAEWLLFIDTDVEFLPENVYGMLKLADDEHQILAGLYF